MKFLNAVLFTSLILKAAAFGIDPNDDRTLEYYLAKLFENEDPEKYEVVKAEVQNHADELLEAFFSVVGDGFEFDRSIREKLNEDFDVEHMHKVMVAIFGLGSEVVAQLEMNSGVVKQKLMALVDSLLGGPSRRKRSLLDKGTPDSKKGLTEIPKDILNKAKKTVGKEEDPKTKDGEDSEKKDGDIKLHHDGEDSEKKDGDIKLHPDGEDSEKKDGDIKLHHELKSADLDKENGDPKDHQEAKKAKDESDKKNEDPDKQTDREALERSDTITELLRNFWVEYLKLKVDEHEELINGTAKALEQQEVVLKSVRKDARDFLASYSNRLADILRKFGDELFIKILRL